MGKLKKLEQTLMNKFGQFSDEYMMFDAFPKYLEGSEDETNIFNNGDLSYLFDTKEDGVKFEQNINQYMYEGQNDIVNWLLEDNLTALITVITDLTNIYRYYK
jgi:hypothetical protein